VTYKPTEQPASMPESHQRSLRLERAQTICPFGSMRRKLKPHKGFNTNATKKRITGTGYTYSASSH